MLPRFRGIGQKQMKIINPQNIINNQQICGMLGILGEDYTPQSIVVYETRWDIIKFFPECYNFAWEELLGKLEGAYDEVTATVYLFIFVQTDDGDDVHSKQLYSLHALVHELRHRFQTATNYLTKDDVRAEEDADKFATAFINQNSHRITKIMNWQDEWTIEEE